MSRKRPEEIDHVVRIDEESTKDIGKQVRAEVEKDYSIGGKLDAIGSGLDDMASEINNLSRRLEGLENLDKKVDELREEIRRIEKTKAAAERQALEDLRSTLSEQLEKKRDEYERRVGEVLDDYRKSVETLKDRFVDSISGRTSNFDQVEEEFGTVREHRQHCVEPVRSVGGEVANSYQGRIDSLVESRDAFSSAVDDFVTDRRETAETIERLQTDIPGIDSAARIVVPFWVVGVQVDGREEIRVLPIMEVGDPSQKLERATPYQSNLRPHPRHNYEEMIEAVQAYVRRDSVWDRLAKDEGSFADPSFLLERNRAMDRFEEALRYFELQNRVTNGAEQSREQSRERTREEAVADD